MGLVNLLFGIENFMERIYNMKNKMCILGLGYIGFPLAHAFSKKFSLDINTNEVKNEYNLDLVDNYSFNGYKAVIIAVGHDKYRNIYIENNDKVIYDINSILKRSDGRL